MHLQLFIITYRSSPCYRKYYVFQVVFNLQKLNIELNVLLVTGLGLVAETTRVLLLISGHSKVLQRQLPLKEYNTNINIVILIHCNRST